MVDQLSNGVPVLVEPNGVAQELERVPLTPAGKGAFDEAWLQRLIHQNPECLPIGEIEPGLDRFTAICMEMPTPRGPIDNLLMTGRGDLCIVEAKLFRNPEARRQALAQAMDYATAMFGMPYEDFEAAILKGNFSPREKSASLFEGLPEADKLNEAAFVDAVSRNLRHGRALILLVGDGIRSEAEALLTELSSHARFGFTLALVELGVFRLPGDDRRLLVRPRTLARTTIVRRTVIEISGSGVVTAAKDEELAAPETLSSNALLDTLDAKEPGARARLEKLIHDVEPLGIYPEFLKSLNLKWNRTNGRSVNLGYIFRHTSIWTDMAFISAPRDLARAYVDALATAWGCDARTLPTSGNVTLYKDGRPLRLATVIDRLDAWVPVMRDFITSITLHDAENQPEA